MAKKIYIGFGLNGVNTDRYGGWDGHLNAAENDIQDMSAMAYNQDFDVIKKFIGEDATILNLRQAFASVRKEMGTEGGLLWFNFSGHGGQVMGHETICLYDQQILDTSLRKEFLSFPKSVRVVAMFDSCHSGGMDRGLFAQNLTNDFMIIKAMPPDAAILAADNIEKKVVRVPKGESTVKILAACQKEESAYDGAKNGLFTAAFKATMQKKEARTYTHIITETTALIAKMQRPRLVTVPDATLFRDDMTIFD